MGEGKTKQKAKFISCLKPATLVTVFTARERCLSEDQPQRPRFARDEQQATNYVDWQMRLWRKTKIPRSHTKKNQTNKPRPVSSKMYTAATVVNGSPRRRLFMLGSDSEQRSEKKGGVGGRVGRTNQKAALLDSCCGGQWFEALVDVG